MLALQDLLLLVQVSSSSKPRRFLFLVWPNVSNTFCWISLSSATYICVFISDFMLHFFQTRYNFVQCLFQLTYFRRWNPIAFFLLFKLFSILSASFGITKKTDLYYLIIFVRSYITNEGIFLNLFCNGKSDWSLVLDVFYFS